MFVSLNAHLLAICELAGEDDLVLENVVDEANAGMVCGRRFVGKRATGGVSKPKEK